MCVLGCKVTMRGDTTKVEEKGEEGEDDMRGRPGACVGFTRGERARGPGGLGSGSVGLQVRFFFPVLLYSPVYKINMIWRKITRA